MNHQHARSLARASVAASLAGNGMKRLGSVMNRDRWFRNGSGSGRGLRFRRRHRGRFRAMQDFLDAEQLPLHRIVHGEQRFAYQRPVVDGDVLTATLTVSSVRSIGGNDVIATTSEITDADDRLVCIANATLVHRGEDA